MLNESNTSAALIHARAIDTTSWTVREAEDFESTLLHHAGGKPIGFWVPGDSAELSDDDSLPTTKAFVGVQLFGREAEDCPSMLKFDRIETARGRFDAIPLDFWTEVSQATGVSFGDAADYFVCFGTVPSAAIVAGVPRAASDADTAIHTFYFVSDPSGEMDEGVDGLAVCSIEGPEVATWVVSETEGLSEVADLDDPKLYLVVWFD